MGLDLPGQLEPASIIPYTGMTQTVTDCKWINQSNSIDNQVGYMFGS